MFKIVLFTTFILMIAGCLSEGHERLRQEAYRQDAAVRSYLYQTGRLQSIPQPGGTPFFSDSAHAEASPVEIPAGEERRDRK